MGCTSCRISQIDTQFFRTCRPSNTFVVDFQPLLNHSDRNFWLHQLCIKNTPEDDFWQQYNGSHHSCFTQIQKDINRTFPTMTFFSHKAHVSRFQLLLRKFAIYFPKIGYTQGLNFLAGYLLMCGFDDDSAFKGLVQLMVHEKIMAIGLYEDQFPLNRFYCEVFWNLLYCKLPKVAQKIRKAHVQDEIWIFQWFISFFLYSFPTQFVKRFWDIVILKKQLSIVLVALGIVRCLKNQILSLKHDDQFQFIQLFQQTKDLSYCNKYIDLKKLITFINSITPSQLQKSITSTTCISNNYRKYFTCSLSQRTQIHSKMLKYFKYERTSFKSNPRADRFKRTKDSTNHLQNLMLSKYKLYQSQFKGSIVSQNLFKMSTFSINVQNMNINTNENNMDEKNKMFANLQADKKSIGSYSNSYNNGFQNGSILNRINFTQSKVLENGFKFGDSRINMKKSRNYSPNQKNNKAVNPFQQIQQKNNNSNNTNNMKISINGNFKNTESKQYHDFSKKNKPYYIN